MILRQVLNAGLIAAAAIVISVTPAWGADGTNLQASIERVLLEEGLTGITWSLVRETGEVSLGNAGFQDNQTRSKFNANTRVHVGSLTKSLLATGILRLATEQRISLDAPISQYLPDLVISNHWSATSEPTVRHLLDHTAGLNDAQMWQIFSERPTPDTPLIAAFPDPPQQLTLRSKPGSRFSYSNLGYTLLGMIIESVVNSRYETYLDQHLLAPLKMNDSTFTFTTQEGESANAQLAWGHVDDGSRYQASPMFLRPAGQFTTTAADLARFAQFLLSDGSIDNRPFVEEELMRARGRVSDTDAADAGLNAGYALGLGRRDRHGVIGYCHSGNIVGFVAMLCIYPEEHKALAYSINTDSETADYGRIESSFIRALAIADASPPRSLDADHDIAQWHGRYILSPNRFQAFQYLDNVFGAIKISANDSLLLMESLQGSPRQLRPVGGLQYSANDRATASHVFTRSEDGAYLLSDGFQTYEKVSSIYLLLHWCSVAAGLVGLTWLLISGVLAIGRHGAKMLQQPQAPGFGAIALLFSPIPFFMNQSFMALGDQTIASTLLAATTLLLPVGMVLTAFRAKKVWRESHLNLIHGLAALCVLQWCAVLLAHGMLPFRLWV